MDSSAHPVGLPPRRGLVIGAGAAVGGAWAMGVLCALAETEGFDASASEVIVGTSAGSVLAALISCRVPPRLAVQTLTGSAAGPVRAEAVVAADASDHVHRALAHIPRPVPLPGNPRLAVQTLTGSAAGPVRAEAVVAADASDHVHRALAHIPRPVPLPGNPRLAARTLALPGRRSVRTAAAALAPRGRGDLAPVGELIEEFCGDQGWPARPRTWLVAMDFDSGRRVVFGAAGQPEASMAQAVMASCSAPGLFPPRLIGDRRYIDGGAVSVTNADLLTSEDLDEVVVLAPMAMHESPTARSAAPRSAAPIGSRPPERACGSWLPLGRTSPRWEPTPSTPRGAAGSSRRHCTRRRRG
jgi:NTE family protein